MAYRNTSTSSIWLWLGIATLIGLIDQFSKVMIVGTLRLHDSIHITSFFDIVRWHNTGAAFSFLHTAGGWQRWFFIGIGVLAAALIVWMLRRHAAQRLFCWALALILAGAVGNVIDRAVYGYVVDFIHLHYKGASFPAFNVADSAITLGAVLLIVDELRRVRRG
jgi:signal peptidase II